MGCLPRQPCYKCNQAKLLRQRLQARRVLNHACFEVDNMSERARYAHQQVCSCIRLCMSPHCCSVAQLQGEHVMLCRAVPCRAVPCRAVPCRAVPCRAVPCRAVLCCVMLCMLCCAACHAERRLHCGKTMLLTDLDMSLDESSAGLLAFETLPSAVVPTAAWPPWTEVRGAKTLHCMSASSGLPCLEHGTSAISTLQRASSRPVDLGSMQAATSSL